MAIHWVQAVRSIARFNLGGAYVMYHPGDWFQVRNQELSHLVEAGAVKTTLQIIGNAFDLSGCGILIRGRDKDNFLPKLPDDIGIRQGRQLALPWPRTMLWAAKERINAGAVLLGLGRVEARDEYDAWEMAVRLRNTQTLAGEIGSKAEQAKTLEVVGDLRLPVYDTSAVWVRRTPGTENFLGAWQSELDQGADEAQSFLRVLYTRRILLCTLPPNFGERCEGYYM